MKESQNDLILRYLQSGKKITALDALQLFGSFRLSARIHDLKQKGYAITSEIITTSNGKKVACYSIPATNWRLELF